MTILKPTIVTDWSGRSDNIDSVLRGSEPTLMQNGLSFDALIDALADRVAAKVAERTQQGAPVKPRLLSVEQAAVYIGRTKEAVQHMIASAKLPTVRTDRRVFIDVLDLDRWIDTNKRCDLV
jgi:excisionase family DNA binding protein